MKCNHCGKEIVDDSVFCEYCGKKVGAGPKRPLFVIIIVTVVLLAMAIIIGSLRQSSVPEAGTVLSYTERVTSEEGYDDVTSYFVFRESPEVIWLMGKSQQNMFPVGFGKYNPSTSEISFSVSDTLHQSISIYDGIEDAIVFNIDMTKKTAILKTDDKWLKPLYNDGNAFALNKEDYTLKPSEALVGSHWRGRFGNYSIAFVFKSWNEVMIIEDDGEEEPHAYVCFDDMVSIKAGDNLEYENLIGNHQGGNEMILCRRGLDTVSHSDECVTLRRITTESDTEAFQACQTVDDYRDYIRSYGPNARFYTAAKNYVDEYESDSIAYAGCTTIKACDAYLDTYPNGHFVEEVKTRKVELQNNPNHVLKQGNIYVLTEFNIESFISYSYNTPVIVDFYGDWCPPCKKMKPVLNELINEYNGKVFLGRFNVDYMHESRACKKFGIEVVPNLLFIRNGEVVGRHVGFNDGDKEVIRNEIEQYFFSTNQHGNSSQRKKQLEEQGYVDLGLPSGTLWKDNNENEFYSYNDAIKQFGANLPSINQLWELRNKCRWILQKNQHEYVVTGPNGNSIIVPLVGIKDCDGYLKMENTCGHLLSSTQADADHIWSLRVFDDYLGKDYGGEICTRFAVRLAALP